MQTVASIAKRLDMTAEEAVEKLRYMLFDVEGVDSVITDEQIDLLIDIDENPSKADEVRAAKLKEAEQKQKRAERLKSAVKKAAAGRRKKTVQTEEQEGSAETTSAATEAPAKPKRITRRKKAAEPITEESTVQEPTQTAAPPPPTSVAEILPAEAPAPKTEKPTEEKVVVEKAEPPKETKEPAEAEKKPTPAPPAQKPKKPSEPQKPKAPPIAIGIAAGDREPAVRLVRADGTLVTTPDEVIVDEKPLMVEKEEEEVSRILVEAELRQEEEEKRKARLAAKPLAKPDPAVVAEVKRKAAEREQKLKAAKAAKSATAQKPGVGKTARKRQKKAEKARQEEALRREAAATVRSIQGSLGPTGIRRRRKHYGRGGEDEGVEEIDVNAPIPLEIEEGMTVEQLALAMDVPVNDIILSLMDLEILATKNSTLSVDVIRKIAEQFGYEPQLAIPEEDEVLAEEPDDPADLQPRAPVVTVMGHVDHGKTTLLDRIRKSNVAAGEVGGITQHIAAYDVQVGTNRVVFLDTPGHEAFTEMRARGAKVTDIVILVVAADDGVMPQTVEAIDHARAAEVPIVVAINKIDKPGAQPDRIRQELVKYDLVSEEWGGKTIMKNISAKTGEGVDELMELLVLQAELMELKANPKKRARGTVIESEISRGQGPVAWVLIQSGTLREGDVFLAGRTSGRVRSMLNSRGARIREAGPSTPVLIMGFSEPPDAGDTFVVVEDERLARSIAEKRAAIARQKEGQARRHITLEDFHARVMAGEKPELHMIIKADVQGSVDVLESSIMKLAGDQVRIHIVHSGVGGINESDVMLASASDAVIIGFHVTANMRAQKRAEEEGVDIRTYQIIYEALEDIRLALEGMLAPETKEVITGHAEIRKVFRSSALGNIAGCAVLDGEITRGSLARVVRDDVVIYQGRIASLRREKDDARSVAAGFECGIKLENFEDIKVHDIIETYRLETIAKTLA